MFTRYASWILFALSGFCCLEMGAVLPLRDQWRAACRHMANGEAGQACQLFEEFDQWYGEEPETRENSFRKKQLRLWGLASLQAGNHSKGVSLLNQWLQENPPPANYHAFVRFQLASCYAYSGQLDEAARHWEAFLQENPHLPEAALVHWKLADYRITQSLWPGAEAHLKSALAHPQLPLSGQALVKAALALLELSRDNDQAAMQWLHLMGTGSRVERLWQAILAPALASRLIGSDLPEDALRITSWFTRPENLEKDLFHLLRTESPPTGLRQLVWNSHWKQQAALLESNIRKSVATGELETSQYQLKLSSLRRCGQARHSFVLAQALLTSASPVADSLRSLAYCEAIESCHVFNDWIQADTLVDAFLQSFPEHPDLPDILYLQARSSAGRGDFEKALLRINQLIVSYPNQPSLMKWKLSEAAWTLAAGRPSEALPLYIALENCSPKGWQPFIQFQKGRCEEGMRNMEAAASHFHNAVDHAASTSALQEQTLLALLKLHLRTLDSSNFEKIRKRYHSDFPEGINLPNVEILTATWLQQTGRFGEAIQLLEKLSEEPHGIALQAYGQLSGILRQRSDIKSLISAAEKLITLSIDRPAPLPELPFNDLLYAQEILNDRVLDASMLCSLIRMLDSPAFDCPDILLLRLLTNQWQAYRNSLELPPGIPEEWLEAQAVAHLESGRLRPYASYNLFLAERFEKMGRKDSADARRIQVLQSVDPETTGEQVSRVLALTAAEYDFPEAGKLLETFLRRFPGSHHRPDILFHLAAERRSQSMDTLSRKLLRKVRDDWPDSGTFPHACVLLAEWLIKDGIPEEALSTLTILLDRGDLDPRTTAKAILLRARLYFQTGDLAKGHLNCQRLLQLYPAYHDISATARALIIDHPVPHDA